MEVYVFHALLLICITITYMCCHFMVVRKTNVQFTFISTWCWCALHCSSLHTFRLLTITCTPNCLRLAQSHRDSLTLNVERLNHIMVDQLEVLVANPVLHIAFAAGEEVIHHSHLVAIHHQLVCQVGPHEARPSSDLEEGARTGEESFEE